MTHASAAITTRWSRASSRESASSVVYLAKRGSAAAKSVPKRRRSGAASAAPPSATRTERRGSVGRSPPRAPPKTTADPRSALPAAAQAAIASAVTPARAGRSRNATPQATIAAPAKRPCRTGESRQTMRSPNAADRTGGPSEARRDRKAIAAPAEASTHAPAPRPDGPGRRRRSPRSPRISAERTITRARRGDSMDACYRQLFVTVKYFSEESWISRGHPPRSLPGQPARGGAGSPHAALAGNERVLLQGVEGELLPGRSPRLGHARLVRGALPGGRDQQHVLPDAEPQAPPGMGRAGAGGVPLRAQGVAQDHASEEAGRCRRGDRLPGRDLARPRGAPRAHPRPAAPVPQEGRSAPRGVPGPPARRLPRRARVPELLLVRRRRLCRAREVRRGAGRIRHGQGRSAGRTHGRVRLREAPPRGVRGSGSRGLGRAPRRA